MTFEELKAEAERQGYRLVKKNPYVQLKKCPNCDCLPELWLLGGEWFRKCPICFSTGGRAKTQIGAKKSWNEMVDRYSQKEET